MARHLHLILISLIFCFYTATAQAAKPRLKLDDVGEVYMANSGARKAQQDFHHGLAQLHNFEFDDAEEAFKKARDIDPDFALAYWGEAMTHNHPLWWYQDKEAALEILNAYAETPDARQQKAPTEFAKDLFRAIDTLYCDAEKEICDDRYRLVMKELYEKYPDNVEIAAFYGLSIMATDHEGRNFATYMLAAAIMERFRPLYPNHPGLAHYLIHSTDDPIHAPLGLDAAKAYGDIAPNAAHAQHMTSHIYLALGDWDGVIRANLRSTALINKERRENGKMDAGCGHASSWLMYGYLQKGMREEAHDLMVLCAQNASVDEPSRSLAFYFSWQRLLYMIDTGEWDGDVAAMTNVNTDAIGFRQNMTLANGWVALKTGNLDAADGALRQLRQIHNAMEKEWDANGVAANDPTRAEIKVEALQLEGAMALARGQTSKALTLMRQAADLEATLPFGYGPPAPAKPSHELLGETLLALGKMDEARKVLTEALSRTHNKRLSLAALAAVEAATPGSNSNTTHPEP